jgi:prepilin signal peptidase PulO-like enzyme (type II secretory pathway)
MMTIFLGALVGTIVFAPVSLRTDREVPFGVFLAVGAATTFLLGDALIAWYTGMFM